VSHRPALPAALLSAAALVFVVCLVLVSSSSGDALPAPVSASASASPTVSASPSGTPTGPAYLDVSMSGRPLAANPGNPLAGGLWSVNTGYWDQGLFSAYTKATGSDQAYLAKSALQPRALWFTLGNSGHSSTAVANYIATEQHGDPSVLVQMAIFGIWGYGGEDNRLKQPLTATEIADYQAWIQSVSAQIGTARVAIILEPDLALAVKRRDLPKSQRTKGARGRQLLAAYAAKTFHDHNPQAAVYLDAGDADWLTIPQATALLQRSGIQYARGFALGATHYSSTQDDIEHGAALVAALARKGVTSHLVIDTADNGRPFTYAQFYRRHPATKGGFFDDSFPCRSQRATVCNALGVPPTWKVTSTALSLTAAQRRTAARLVDGYLWFGRPWLKDQATPFVAKKAILAGKYSPF